MMEQIIGDCYVCRKHRGEVNVPGGILFENDLVCITHAQIRENEREHYLGHLFVEPKRHVTELGELSGEEARELGYQVGRAARTLTAILGVEHVYSFVIGDGVPHVHFHVIGRYPGAPREYWGAKVDEWPEAPHGDAAAIAKLAEKLREWLAQPLYERSKG